MTAKWTFMRPSNDNASDFKRCRSCVNCDEWIAEWESACILCRFY